MAAAQGRDGLQRVSESETSLQSGVALMHSLQSKICVYDPDPARKRALTKSSLIGNVDGVQAHNKGLIQMVAAKHDRGPETEALMGLANM
ncbi:hypothetical protein PENSUB_6042 [Penicillium subrubescens]|uniref:Uncharacterized protein n=1 Tax=Penicillium subrubescens TaxID=1316194 RepID=A0A1Q5U4P3_9EURO|nr:hypothetical protein PENSUB_6042 [Penicillium subrubescens]